MTEIRIFLKNILSIHIFIKIKIIIVFSMKYYSIQSENNNFVAMNSRLFRNNSTKVIILSLTIFFFRGIYLYISSMTYCSVYSL